MVKYFVVFFALLSVAVAQMTKEEQKIQWAEYFCKMGVLSYCTEPSPSPVEVAETVGPSDEGDMDNDTSPFPFVRSSGVSSDVVVAFAESTATSGSGMKNACKQKDPAQVCNLPWKGGPCRGYIIRYYYNSTTNKCERKGFGGCYGNDNNFISMHECNACCKFAK